MKNVTETAIFTFLIYYSKFIALCNSTYVSPQKSPSNKSVFTNQRILQKTFKKVVDNAEKVWYYNQAVTERTAQEEAERQKPEAK